MSPESPAEKKSWFARHKILTAVLVIIALVIIGNAIGGDDDPKPATSTTTSDNAGDEDSTENNEEAPTAGLGQAVEADDFTVTVTNMEAGVARVGDEYFGEDASGQYVIIGVEVTNTQDKAAYFFDDKIKLIDDQGREHSSSSDAWMLEENILIDEINPGVTRAGQILFDIPADAVPTSLAIDSGLFSTPVQVTLK